MKEYALPNVGSWHRGLSIDERIEWMGRFYLSQRKECWRKKRKERRNGLKINWKVRLRNPMFLVTAAPVVVSLIYTTVQLITAIRSGTFSDSYVNTVAAYAVQLLTLLGITNDPTTAGICDSERAQYYEKPHADDEENR